MYKVITSFWSKSSDRSQSSPLESPIDEDSWVFVLNTGKN